MDLGDGVRAIYQNLTVTDEPIQHRYKTPGIYRVTVKAENMAGHDQATMYIQVTGRSYTQSGLYQLVFILCIERMGWIIVWSINKNKSMTFSHIRVLFPGKNKRQMFSLSKWAIVD